MGGVVHAGGAARVPRAASGLGQPRQRGAERSRAGAQADLGQLGRGLQGRLEHSGRRGCRGGGRGISGRRRLTFRTLAFAGRLRGRRRPCRGPRTQSVSGVCPRGGGLGAHGLGSGVRRCRSGRLGSGVRRARSGRLELGRGCGGCGRRGVGRAAGGRPLAAAAMRARARQRPDHTGLAFVAHRANHRKREGSEASRGGAGAQPDAENRPSSLKRPGELVVYIDLRDGRWVPARRPSQRS